MTPLDDELLTALRAARPAPGYQPSATSPEATAMLAGILQARQDPAPRVTRRRLLLAGLPAMAGAAAAAVLAASVTSSGPGSTHPTVSSVRTAVLAAFEHVSGDIVYTTRTTRRPKGPMITQRAWTYPAFPAPGEQVRFRLFVLNGGVPVEDTESIYVQDTASGGLTQPTTEGPRTAEIIDVEYATRTWSRQQSSSVLLAGNLSPSLIRDQIAGGGFTVVGTVRVQGHQAVELTWSRSPGRLTVTTTLWVDARTYVPLRSVATTRAGLHDMLLWTDTTEYHMLSATSANLGLLTPPIPTGFTRIARSPHF
ncbi:MAG TPA: hypothetical protein VE733_07310 [Streptosporangiaceae bacterium]|jgi:outer membrane lipoprotein-sorting protein|nr:hypothetical protein [Streptosporangiaceae bacterium]